MIAKVPSSGKLGHGFRDLYLDLCVVFIKHCLMAKRQIRIISTCFAHINALCVFRRYNLSFILISSRHLYPIGRFVDLVTRYRSLFSKLIYQRHEAIRTKAKAKLVRVPPI
jgi:hypothetical protein